MLMRLLAYRMQSLNQRVLLIGAKERLAVLGQALRVRNVDVKDATYGDDNQLREAVVQDRLIVLCLIPGSEAEWRELAELRERYPVTTAYELFLPITFLLSAQSTLPYFMSGLEMIAPYLLGEKPFGYIDRFDSLVGLRGKSVLEFGPLDGYQTAGLVHAGAKSVTCVDVRAVNLLKIIAAREAFGWSQVTTLIDDLHNVHGRRHGRYGAVCAHGVHYHSVAPFLFFENLLSLSDAIFLGGFCATEASPEGPFETLSWKGEYYRAKRHAEPDNVMSGVNPHGYFFHADDLAAFFARQGCTVTVLADEPSPVQAGRLVRLAIQHTAV